MRFIYDDTCLIQKQIPQDQLSCLESYLCTYLNLSTNKMLRYVVITGDNPKALSNAIQRFATPDLYGRITDDSNYEAIGQTLCYLIDEKLVVDIFFCEHIFFKMLCLASDGSIHLHHSDELAAAHYFAHEVGHAYYFLVKNTNQYPFAMEKSFDLRNEKEMKEFLFFEADTLISEYFAERLSNCYYPYSSGFDGIALQQYVCDTNFPLTVNTLLSRAFRILYIVSLELACTDSVNESNASNIATVLPPFLLLNFETFHQYLLCEYSNTQCNIHNENCHGIGKILWKIATYLGREHPCYGKLK